MPTRQPTAFLGRTRELGALHRALDAPGASHLHVAGLAGVGKTRLVRHAAGDHRSVYHVALPLPEPLQRAALARSLDAALGTGVPGEPPSWDALFAAVLDAASQERPLVLVVDEAQRWDASRARFRAPLAGMLARARERGRGVHVVLVWHELPAEDLPGEAPALELLVHPLPFRAAAAALPGETPRERLRAWAVFGGAPAQLALVDPDASLAANLRRLILAPGAPLADAPLALLERLFQNPTRYAAILSALAPTEGDWSTVQGGVPDLSASGQAAPYLKRLEEVGLVEARRSLDAPPQTRSRRYRVRDPFIAFWFRFVLPHRQLLAEGSGDALLADVIRPLLDAHADAVFAQACREFMTHDAMELLGANARECGSLWGPGHDIPVAGTLGTGAPFYGAPHPFAGASGASALRGLDAHVRATRYGFGRERRLRLIFLRDEAPLALQREAARRHDAVVVGLEEILGRPG